MRPTLSKSSLYRPHFQPPSLPVLVPSLSCFLHVTWLEGGSEVQQAAAVAGGRAWERNTARTLVRLTPTFASECN
ncbi:hypothetical protein Hamer_G031456 [Homarus americanus]|uniref:Uncharacterized protein n=1 Tax=Homarus americanus TaxID=6706 RepID=A0A8J5MXQ0_HOMAM|nr:hypothetical protein Hamer_G031456 [Homarus americanus]